MEDNEIGELRQRIDILIGLTLCQLEKRSDPDEIISVLSRFPLESQQIAAVLGMTPNAVRVARHRSKKPAGPSKRRSRARK